MQLSDEQRLIVLMLCDISALLNIGGGDRSTFEKDDLPIIKKFVADGNEWAIPLSFSGLHWNDQNLPQAVTEVFSILDAWRDFEASLGRLSSGERAQLEQQFGVGALSFDGFDSAYESDRCRIVQAIVEDIGRYPEFRSRTLCAASPRLERHKRLCSRYERLRNDEEITAGHISFDQFLYVFQDA